jgi:hypothetical protein
MASKVRVAIVGLGFGAEFIPIYQQHPDAEMYAICRRDKAEMDKVGERSWPIFGALYFLVAVKRVRGMRLLEPAWKAQKATATAPVAIANQVSRPGTFSFSTTPPATLDPDA